jgi:hypothetical protein
LYNDGALSRK